MYPGRLWGGTEYTLQCCVDHNKPHLLIDATTTPSKIAATLIQQFVRQENIETLNVAGPRQSEWGEGYDYCFATMEKFLQ